MFTHPGPIGQLAREHHQQMLAQASQRQLRHQHSRPAASTRIIRRLAAAIARAGVAARPRRRRAPSGPPDRTRPANPPPGPRFQAAATDGKATPSAGNSVQPSVVAAAASDRWRSGNYSISKGARIPVMCRAFC